MKLTTFDEAMPADAVTGADETVRPGVACAQAKHDPASKDCRLVGDILSRVGEKWSMLVVMTLLGGPLRFNELKRSIRGVSQQMLSRTVRTLERDGLLIRTVHPTVPVRVEYQLSDLGRSLSGPVQALGAWALTNREAIESSRSQYDQTYDEA